MKFNYNNSNYAIEPFDRDWEYIHVLRDDNEWLFIPAKPLLDDAEQYSYANAEREMDEDGDFPAVFDRELFDDYIRENVTGYVINELDKGNYILDYE